GLAGGGAGFGGAQLGFAGGMTNLGAGGGLLGIGGGQLGQFGNLGGQFGLQGGDPNSVLIALIQQLVAPGEWGRIIPANQPGGVAPPPAADADEQPTVPRELQNQLGYYPPARALIVRGSSRIHTRAGGGFLSRPNAPPPGMGALD